MATLTAEQIEPKKQLLAEKMKEAKTIYDELVDAGAIELSDDDLDQAAGGGLGNINPNLGVDQTILGEMYPCLDLSIPKGLLILFKSPT